MLKYTLTQEQYNNFKKNMVALSSVNIMQLNNISGVIKTDSVQADYFYSADQQSLSFSSYKSLDGSNAEESLKTLIDAEVPEAVGSGSERWDHTAWTEAGDGTKYPGEK